MDLERIKASIKKREPGPLGVNQFYAVLIPLVELDNKLHLLFEVRAEDLSTQPGEISLPGGRMEPGESREETALRETKEELRLLPKKIELLGELDFLVTVYNLIIYSFAGRLEIKSLKEVDFNPGEVKDIFTVPLEFFRENPPQCYRLKVSKRPVSNFPYHLIPGGREYNWRTGKHPVYFYNYREYIIWGFTARLVRSFINNYCL